MRITTEDGYDVGENTRVFNYYDQKFGEITRIGEDGWARVTHDDGSIAMLDGSRMAFAERYNANGEPVRDPEGLLPCGTACQAKPMAGCGRTDCEFNVDADGKWL